MPAGADHAAVQGLGIDGALDVGPALAEAQNPCFQDTVVTQILDGGGSVRRRPVSSVRARGPVRRLMLDTPIPTGPRAPLLATARN